MWRPIHLYVSVIGAALATGAPAQNVRSKYPDKPVRMMVAFAPGGSSDIVARVLAQHLSQLWGQQVVVDNRPGAGGMLGHEIGSRAPPDGIRSCLLQLDHSQLIPAFTKRPRTIQSEVSLQLH